MAWVCWNELTATTNTAHHRVCGESRLAAGLGAELAVCARAKPVQAVKAVYARKRDT